MGKRKRKEKKQSCTLQSAGDIPFLVVSSEKEEEWHYECMIISSNLMKYIIHLPSIKFIAQKSPSSPLKT